MTQTEQGSDPNPVRRARAQPFEYPGLHGKSATSPNKVAEPDNLVLEHLKKIQAELSAARERDEALLARMSALEAAMLSVKREVLLGDETDARLQVCIDGIVRRIERIERRLELTE